MPDSPFTPTVFLSYTWNDSAVADRVDEALQLVGLTVQRDQRELSYTKSIEKFMKTIRKTNFVMPIISDGFLRSEACMNEIEELCRDDDYRLRLLPVLHGRFEILSSRETIKYIAYWDNEYLTYEKQVASLSDVAKTEATKRLRKIGDIRSKVGGFLETIADMLVYRLDHDVPVFCDTVLLRLWQGRPEDDPMALEWLEAILYSCRMNRLCETLNRFRVELLARIANSEDMAHVWRRRFAHAIGTRTGAMINALPETLFEGKDALLNAVIDADISDANVAGHVLLSTVISGRESLQFGELEDMLGRNVDLNRFPILAALMQSSNTEDPEEAARALQPVLLDLADRVSDRDGREAWATLSDAQRSLSEGIFRRTFAVAHHKFLRHRSTRAQPYVYPLLSIHSGYGLTGEDYSELLCGKREEQIAALWTLSLTGVNSLVYAQQVSLTRLNVEARSNITQMTKELKSRDLWRLASAVAVTSLPELGQWLSVMACREDELDTDVTINDPKYVELNEPHIGIYIRGLAWIAVTQQANESSSVTPDSARSVIDSVWDDRRFRKRVAPAIVTAYGILGNGVPIVEHLDSRNLWLHETALNIAEYWIVDEGQRSAMLSAIEKRLNSVDAVDGPTTVTLNELRRSVLT